MVVVETKDSVILETLKKVSDRRKLVFTLKCLERISFSSKFNKSDAMLFGDTLFLMKECLNEKAKKEKLYEFISYIAERCEALHRASTSDIRLIEDQWELQSRSYAADAVYSAAELVYHYLAGEQCPVNMMHVLENIRLSKKWYAHNDSKKDKEECEWQLNYANNFLATEPNGSNVYSIESKKH